ncbi:heavy metal translocating P-type ATPase [Accumulibacter sp.]|uniref:Heavy metal translocating P-type ATPase n=1 Tax=Accumulibacter regalis TaxID=522306 RepID=C7RME3_ACCRE|nr:heavy metal translocating P-type ATPase [Accumulibacter sp.]MBN8498261.1 copper-translocating P-type ATPase [Accumulibacter sp.]MBO3717166.1 copper-translocating P-type ATPase [Accumulibacter sp.]
MSAEAYRNFRVAHRLIRRVRVVAPPLVRNVERCYILEILLRKRPEISEVRAVPEIGSLAIHYDPGRLPEQRLLAIVDGVLGNLITCPPARPAASVIDGAPLQEHSLAIEGMSCASCALLIELSLRRDPRVQLANVNFAAQTAIVRGTLSRDDVFALVGRLGYRAQPMDTLAQRRLLVEREKGQLMLARKRVIVAAALTAPVMLLGMAMHRSPTLRVLEFALATPVLLGPGREIFDRAWRLAQQKSANMDSLIALGAGAAYLYSLPGLWRPNHHVYFEAAAGIISFVLLGRFLEERAKGQASEAIRKLIELQAETAVLLCDGQEHRVAIDEVVLGDLLRVRPGDRVPTDGVLVDGSSEVNESMLTGESLPVGKRAGDKAYAGCLNGNGTFTLRVTAVGVDTVLAGIVRLVDHAQGSKLPVQKLADRISARFVPAVGGIAALTFGGGLLARSHPTTALAHAIAVLLIACPCALGLATPTAIMVGTGQAARRGIYIRNGEALETAARLTTVVFDKTGTITEGKPVVTDFIAVEGVDETALLARMAAAEACSEHFLARAISAWCLARGAAPAACSDFAAIPGRGVRANCEGVPMLIGNAALLEETGVACIAQAQQVAVLAEQGKTPVFVAMGGRVAALLAIADQPRQGARDAIARLHRLGIETVMATGDLRAVAQHIARQVGIERVIARATPAMKLELIHELQQQGKRVGMIGDGINDAPALIAADVGLAIGGGADIAVEAADVTLLGGDIARVAATVELSRRTMSIIRQNLFWALGYNVVAIPIAAAGRLNPMIASAAMAFSSVSVVSNSLRLQKH